MPDLRLFDCNCMLGMGGIAERNQPTTPDALLEEMRYYGLAGALVCSGMARDRDFHQGNHWLLENLPDPAQMWPCAVIEPNTTGDVGQLEEYLSKLARQGVRAIRLCPSVHRFSLKPWCSGDLFEAVMRARLPVFLDVSETNWDELDEILETYPELCMVLTRVPWTGERALYGLLARHRRLFVEISSLQGHCAIEEVCERFSASRLLFGTDLPKKDPGATIAALTYARIEEQERERIAWRNLQELLRLEEVPPARQPAKVEDSFIRHAWEGSPLSETLVIDAHAHTSHYAFRVARNTPEETVATMDVMGVNKACTCGVFGHHVEANDGAMEAVRRFPDRFVGFATLHPRCNGNIEEELERTVARLGMRGLKVHPTAHHCAADDPRYDPVWKFAADRKLPVLAHGGGGPEAALSCYAKVMERFPQVPLLLAHAGRSYASADEYIAVAREHPSVFLEITYSSVTHRIVEYLVKAVGADRVLFGTDMLFRDPRPQLGWVLFSRIAPDEKRKVLGLNVAGLLKLRVRGTGATSA